MKIVGLITEYNPFHKGHEYHIKRAKELTGADACIVIMSGNYVQRGTPAFIDKYTRTHIALNHGADLVFELPLPFACSSAEYFATAAVTLLHKMGCVDYICFGSECDDINSLSDIATILADAKLDTAHKLNHLIQDNVKSGLPYATARSNALCTLLDKKYQDIIDKPNNILAIEYIKSIKLIGSSMIPIAIMRTNASYHHDTSNDVLYSASSIRNAILDNSANTLNELYTFDSIYKDVLGQTAPVYEDDYSTIFIEKLLSIVSQPDGATHLTEYAGIDIDLANRMCNRDIIYKFKSFSKFTQLLKTKNIAYTALSRALLSVTLNIKKTDVDSYLAQGITSYVRLLGFNKEVSMVLNSIKSNGNLCIIGQLSEVSDNTTLTEQDRKMISHSIYCDELFNMILRHKYSADVQNEYSRKIIIK